MIKKSKGTHSVSLFTDSCVEYMLAGETLLDYTDLFSRNDYK